MIDRENRRNVYFCIRKSSPSEKFFYLKDHLGNIRVTIDDESNVVGYNDYYPFGLQMPERSMNNANSEDIYKFSGKELDEEYDLDYYYFGARYYDPAIGRWMVVDPLADKYPELSPYNYCLNNPLNEIDPDGKMPAAVAAILGGAGGTALTVGQIAGLVTLGAIVQTVAIDLQKGEPIGTTFNSLVEGVSNFFDSNAGTNVVTNQDNLGYVGDVQKLTVGNKTAQNQSGYEYQNSLTPGGPPPDPNNNNNDKKSMKALKIVIGGATSAGLIGPCVEQKKEMDELKQTIEQVNEKSEKKKSEEDSKPEIHPQP